MSFRCAAAATLVLGVTMSSAAFAQTSRNVVEFGIEGGATFSTFGGKDAVGPYGTHTGFALGGFLRAEMGPHFALRPALLFVQKGVRHGPPGDVDEIKLGYLQVPFFGEARFPLAADGRVGSHLYVGPAIAFRTGCSISEPRGLPSQTCNDARSKVKSTDFSLVLGGGVDVGHAAIDLRYDLGLTTLDSSSPAVDVKNRTLSVLVGWRLGHLR